MTASPLPHAAVGEIRDRLAYVVSDVGVPSIDDAWRIADAILPTVRALMSEAHAEGYRDAADDSRAVCSRAGGCLP